MQQSPRKARDARVMGRPDRCRVNPTREGEPRHSVGDYAKAQTVSFDAPAISSIEKARAHAFGLKFALRSYMNPTSCGTAPGKTRRQG